MSSNPPDRDPVTANLVQAQRDALAMSQAGARGSYQDAFTVFNCSDNKEGLIWMLSRMPALIAAGAGVEDFDGTVTELLHSLPATVEDVDRLIDEHDTDDPEEER